MKTQKPETELEQLKASGLLDLLKTCKLCGLPFGEHWAIDCPGQVETEPNPTKKGKYEL